MDMFTAISTFVSNAVIRFGGDRIAARHSVRKAIPWSSVRKVSGRARELVQKASVGEGSIERTMAYLCEQLPDLKLSTIDGFVHGAAELTPDQVRSICNSLGASFDYVWRGDGRPFCADRAYFPPVRDYLSLFRGDDVEAITFVRGDKVPHTAYVVLKHDEFRYTVLPHRWHVSSVNGNGGSQALSELAQLTDNLHRAKAHGLIVKGIEVCSKVAEGVLDGDLHPRALWASRYKRSDWWDDLADIHHERVCAKEYSSLYDQEFFAAQELIKWARKDR